MGILNRLQLWWNWLTTDPLGFALYLLTSPFPYF